MKITSIQKFMLALLILLMPSITFSQKVWTVETVPNTRLHGDNIHVSDPDNLLSDSCEMKINEALSSIREKADVFLVALNSIGENTIESFASDLFNTWGIGDSRTDNGVLMLLVMDKHKFRLEVGYGVESTLTDMKCRDITENYIIPYFRHDDYEGGLRSGVAEMLIVFGNAVPDGFVSPMPVEKETPGWIIILIFVGGIVLFVLIVLGLDKLLRSGGGGGSSYSSSDSYSSWSSSSSSSGGSFGGGRSGGGGYTGSW